MIEYRQIVPKLRFKYKITQNHCYYLYLCKASQKLGTKSVVVLKILIDKQTNNLKPIISYWHYNKANTSKHIEGYYCFASLGHKGIC